MWEHFRTNLTFRIISVLLAITLWAWVTSDQNPITEALYDVPLEQRDLSVDLMVADKPSTVKVRVQGRQSVLDNLTSRDYQAFVSLADAQVGNNMVSVEVNLPRGIEVVNVNPSQVPIMIDQIQQIQMPVRPVMAGMMAPTGFSVLDPTLSPTEVLIAGPKSVLDRIADVVVDVSIKEQRESYLERVPIKIYDMEGNTLQDWLKLQPDTVEVFVPIIRDLPSKRFVIKPVLEGELGDRQVKQIIVEPEMVQLFGRWDILDQYDYLYTQPLDLTEVEGNLIQTVEIEVPEGAYLGIPPHVKVVVEMD